MSTFKVEIDNIRDVTSHPNADRLDIVTVKGWQCVTQKGAFKVGDFCVYFPVDSLLPANLESAIFGLDSKIKLTKSRVKTIKLRGAISQGLVVTPELVGLEDVAYGEDVTSILGVTKYEPPKKADTTGNGRTTSKRNSNPNFHKYTEIENAKNYPDLFVPGEEVVAREKIHGTNFRAGWVAFEADTWWKKVLSWLRLAPKFEFVYGSHNVQLQNKLLYRGYYEEEIGNVYAEAVAQYNLEDKLLPGEVVYGEIFGKGIQTDFDYGHKDSRALVVFDVKKDGKYLDEAALVTFCAERRLEMPPLIYQGPYDAQKLRDLSDGRSELCYTQLFREGIVVRPVVEAQVYMGRKILKMIGNTYWLYQHGGADEKEIAYGH